MDQKKTPPKHSVLLYTTGPLAALLGFLTAQRAIITTDQNEALLYALLATFFGTVFFGWLIYIGILLYFRHLDRKDKK